MPECKKIYTEDVSRIDHDRTGSATYELVIEDAVHTIRSGRFPGPIDVVHAGSMYRILGDDVSVWAFRRLGLNVIDAQVWENEDEWRLTRDGKPLQESTAAEPLDYSGRTVPPHLREAFQKASGVLAMVNECHALREGLEGLRESKTLNPALSMEHLLHGLNIPEIALKECVPFSMCPRCGPGLLSKNCSQCIGRGFIDKVAFGKLAQAEIDLIDAA